MIAAELRNRILAGDFADGSLLPKQEDLLDEFGVSPPSLREALRILETEGLVTVQRGNVGGAVVHQPQVERAAYMLGLVMQGRSVTLADVVGALSRLEPACAAECAERRDRRRSVVPRLRANLREGKALLDQPRAYMASARRFHEEIVSGCGNETMALLVGTLETLWAGHVRSLMGDFDELSGGFEERANRQASLEVHQSLTELINAGNAAGAEAAARLHVTERPPATYPFRLDRPVVASTLSNLSAPLHLLTFGS